MRLLWMTAVAVAVLALAACGNNSVREQWEDVRQDINKPFK